MKTDRAGNVIWSSSSTLNSYTSFSDVEIASNGDYILLYSRSARVRRLSDNGNLIWRTNLNYLKTNGDAKSTLELANGNILSYGYNAFFSGKNPTAGALNMFTGSGGVAWFKTIGRSVSYTGCSTVINRIVPIASNRLLAGGARWCNGGAAMLCTLDTLGDIQYSKYVAARADSTASATTYCGPIVDIQVKNNTIYASAFSTVRYFSSTTNHAKVMVGVIDTLNNIYKGVVISAHPLSYLYYYPKMVVNDSGDILICYKHQADTSNNPNDSLDNWVLAKIKPDATVEYAKYIDLDSDLFISDINMVHDTVLLTGNKNKFRQEAVFIYYKEGIDDSLSCYMKTTSLLIDTVSFPLVNLGYIPQEVPSHSWGLGDLIYRDSVYDVQVCGDTVCRSNFAKFDTLSASTSICMGDTVLLYNDDATKVWLRDSVETDDKGDTLFITQSGYYQVAVTDKLGCKDTSESVYVTVNPLPHPVVSQAIDSLICDSYYASYQWYDKQGKVVQGAINWYYKPPYADSFMVRVVDTNGCVGESTYFFFEATSIINVSSGIEAYVSIYPNPTDRNRNVTIRNVLNDNVHLSITSASGQSVASVDISHGYSDISLADIGLSSGLYYFIFECEGYRHPVKVLVY